MRQKGRVVLMDTAEKAAMRNCLAWADQFETPFDQWDDDSRAGYKDVASFVAREFMDPTVTRYVVTGQVRQAEVGLSYGGPTVSATFFPDGEGVVEASFGAKTVTRQFRDVNDFFDMIVDRATWANNPNM